MASLELAAEDRDRLTHCRNRHFNFYTIPGHRADTLVAKNKSAAKQRFWFRWKSTTKWRCKNYDLHNILGYYLMIFARLISLTGLVWAFDWFYNSVSWIANGGKTIESVQEISTSDPVNRITDRPDDLVYEQAQEHFPSAVRYLLTIPTDSISPLTVFVNYKSRFDDSYVLRSIHRKALKDNHLE